MAEANPSLAFEQIQFLSDRFARDWDQKKHPQIETYLQQVPKASRVTLLRNLLLAEVAQRRRLQEDPQVEEYLSRFPDYESVVRQVCSCSITVSVQARAARSDTSIASKALAATDLFTAPPTRQLGNYLLIDELGRGGFGVVWEAEHVEQRYRVALKMLPSDLQNRLDAQDAADRLHKFRQEFRRLRDVNHPNLVGMQRLECDGLQWFFTMDLIKGVDFLSYVRPHDVLNETRLRNALAQMVAGVAELHQRNIIHRDLKPSNVMVSGEGTVVILDFGLVVEMDQRQASQTQVHFAGTPNYAAPEQLDAKPTQASDWYAVGTMLYEALTGRLPYKERDAYTLMRRKVEEAPPVIEEQDLPEDLVALSFRLLRPDANQRPASVELTELFKLHSKLEPTFSETLVGRESQLSKLGAALSEVESGKESLTVFVKGRSGEGKSALVEHFLERLRTDSRFVVLSGRCYDRESVPFKALDSLIDALCSYLRRLGDKAAFLIPDDIAFLVSLFPVMKRVDAVAKALAVQADAEIGDKQVRHRAFAALRVLLQRMGRSHLPILFADDLQWGDGDSAEALFQVLRPPDSPRVLLLGSYRATEAADSPFLKEWQHRQELSGTELEQQHVSVGPLTVEQCQELIASEVDIQIEDDGVEQLLEESGGNPFLLTELLGCVDAATGKVERIPLHAVITRKLAMLPEGAARLLDIISISGQALELEEASRAVGLDSSVFSTMTHMQSERLAKSIALAETTLVDTYHDRIREVVVSQMEGRHRKRLHSSLAKAIEAKEGFRPFQSVSTLIERVDIDEQLVGSRVFDLAYHFDAADENDKACAYALIAAEQAKRSFALDVAAEQYRVANRNAGAASNRVKFQIREGLGEALMLSGHYNEAKDEFGGLAALTDDPVKQARIESFQGDLAYKQGAVKDSVSCFENALKRLGRRVPRTRIGTLLALVRESVIQLIHTLGRKSWFQSKSLGGIEHQLTVEILDRLSMSNWFVFTPKMLWAHLAAMNLAETMPPSRQLVFSYGLHAAPVSVLGMFSRGVKYGEQAIALSKKLNDLWGQGHTYNFRGFGLLGGARYEESIHDLEMAAELLGKTGDFWEINLAKYNSAVNHYRLGDLSEAIEETHALFHQVVRIGDDGAAHWAVDIWSKLTCGNFPFEKLRGCFSPLPENTMNTSMLLQAEGVWHLFHGRTKESVRVLEESWILARKNFVLNMYTVPALVWLATALRLHADDERSKECGRLRSKALSLARWSLRLGRFFPQDKPHALREISLSLEAQGRLRRALKYAERSCKVAAGHKAMHEHAQSSLVCAKLRQKMGMSDSNEQVTEASERLESFQSQVDAKMAEIASEIVPEQLVFTEDRPRFSDG